jgi:hypothetical protein
MTTKQTVMRGRGRGIRGLLLAFVLGGSTTVAAQAPGGATAAKDKPAVGTNEVTIIGCVQREKGNAALGSKAPSGFLLMNASSSPYGGSAGGGSVEQSPAASGPAGTGSGSQPRSGDATPAPGGGAGVSPGITYLLEGEGIEAYAGQRVEVRGTLQAAASGKPPLVPGMQRSGAPASPQGLKVASLRPIAKDCSR